MATTNVRNNTCHKKTDDIKPKVRLLGEENPINQIHNSQAEDEYIKAKGNNKKHNKNVKINDCINKHSYN